ncbi:ATP-binding cassette domain-containing protein [Roseomonas sp. HJA6]|uniref:ATP-binding cassette domain-containing protein n=1 Tax=Roseomonas alba TaxID=2846776 RepID=A0ABS7A4E4_9PROT|nr:ATP-binding cassette domain-containing protein [Neoroseomonas alba]MBW6397058.1 ATP-binding cassette domain-containing protein [Neoroseomonas alba]
MPEADPAGALALRDLSIGVPDRASGWRTLLDVAALDLPAGASLGIEGASGAGKTTLLHVLAGIAAPRSGRLAWGTVELSTLPPRARDAWRRRHVGMVFQDFHLVDGLGATANVLLPVSFEHLRPDATQREAAAALLARLGVPGAAGDVAALSRGERQRVALARALLFRPPVLIADEPTASLDPAAAALVGDLLVGLAAETGATLLVATHDRGLLGRLQRRLRIEDGSLVPA